MTAANSSPAPTATSSQARALRTDLEASGWGVDAVAALLGPVADAALRREQRLPALRALEAHNTSRQQAGLGPDPVATLTALFMLGQPVAAAHLDAAWPRTGTSGALAMGLVHTAEAGAAKAAKSEERTAPTTGTSVRAAVDLRPHEATDATGEVRWWVASDLGELETGRELAPDHVLGIGGAGLTLASLTPRRPATTALDLGCGCGIQTLYLLRHCQQVTTTDISARALSFTAFNTALAGVKPGRLELLQGSFLEPVAGRNFDLVVTNPPFVITPPAVREAGLALMEYRDAGGPVLPTLVPGLGAHLAPGGTAVMLGNWEHHSGQDWRERVSAWLPEDTDAWVIQREQQDPVEYATMWLRDGGSTPERDRTGFEARLGAWIDDFAARSVEAVGFGYLLLHRPEPGAPRAPWRVLEEVTTTGTGALGEHLAQVMEARSCLAAMDDDAVAALHPVVAADVTQERHFRPGDTDPAVILIRQGGGLGRVMRADTALAALVDVADGELSVAQVATALAALSGVEEELAALRNELVAATRELLGVGILTLGEAG
ncbi:Ribosomal RNA small subunit methyltransferase C [Actinomyces bovis]|uniref:Ribosomal RNA small subunit methyltransferase C n=1 Tax=Actinomyces bovis TaxID=1658 RepID=A0ABY1VQI0_9ACTO|nr:methyltransferase [Actinomyces bovis]SPT54275.1 Ribosomal RNA small subunit methyltransferase C [Actinomyces bovis]VEG56404.1 Ribosomal RNA small subunit methyltransferase C [Actinomyces israelii]